MKKKILTGMVACFAAGCLFVGCDGNPARGKNVQKRPPVPESERIKPGEVKAKEALSNTNQ
ncbi:MAG: hypothetical protein CMJ32_07165 [Phycisphaerae bacterium]|nr:hypothetical protein [Phycisphaerae bacterium]